ncbi:peptidase T [Bacillus phage vB_BcoS-136]|uniref:Peptidase T n=1 Tax=Bacillus phage vB_BcoS-136 TaxID=2419619 RepID=A0A3G3BVA5_9CAUD|nr:peptidase T [Bacillus phage vB_BcoS-136]AYP68168.1 peptidase T [Bacillus phage vB_BcoS-136]
MKKMRKQLIELLGIHATSGNEKPVRDYLLPILKELTDKVVVDDYGNLLAEKKVGTGMGSTVLLSAHMDTVRGVLKDRVLIEKDGIITSSKGVLGADDRSGIAIILQVLRSLENIKGFNGTIKVAFSREEEIGCKGAEEIDVDWYKGTDLAIVCDRRGSRDIVVGCGMAFCSDSVGFFMEEVSRMADMNWIATEGGISDAMTFATNGINSVNLSVGYREEHTDKEFVVLSDMRNTVRLILQTLAVINDFAHSFEDVPVDNHWVKSWYYGGKSYGYNYDDTLGLEDIYLEEQDENGEVYVYEIGKDVVIQQGNNEILLSRESLRSLVRQLKDI